MHPVYSWWWRGIPPTPGLAMVLGPPYSALWPIDQSELVGELRFLEQADWTLAQRLDVVVPDELAQRWEPSWKREKSGGLAVNWCSAYPPTWPFDVR